MSSIRPSTIVDKSSSHLPTINRRVGIFRLPAELRNEIYRLVFAVANKPNSLEDHEFAQVSQLTPTIFALLQVNRQLYAEASVILYKDVYHVAFVDRASVGYLHGLSPEHGIFRSPRSMAFIKKLCIIIDWGHAWNDPDPNRFVDIALQIKDNVSALCVMLASNAGIEEVEIEWRGVDHSSPSAHHDVSRGLEWALEPLRRLRVKKSMNYGRISMKPMAGTLEYLEELKGIMESDTPGEPVPELEMMWHCLKNYMWAYRLESRHPFKEQLCAAYNTMLVGDAANFKKIRSSILILVDKILAHGGEAGRRLLSHG
ncbi:hypothetical protein MMC12_004762 [Toensbergia leucococca]|nr:hypothetical protein [Toensbergia leucococca]